MTMQKALIMAGGRGTRLSPITDGLPKPLVPVAGKAVISHALARLCSAGIKNAAVTLGYGGDEIKKHFSEHGTEGVDIQYYEEETPLGTAGSAAAARGYFDGDFIALGGDVVFDFDVSSAFEFHKAAGALATVIVSHSDDPCRYGSLICDKNGKVTAFSEKPTWRRVHGDTVSTGMYILSPRIFDFIRPGEFSDFAKDVFPNILGGALYAYETDGYFCDIGTPAAYLKTNIDAAGGMIGGVSGSPVSPRAKISKDAEIHDSVIMDGAAVGAGATVKNSIVCKDAVVMCGAVVDHAIVQSGGMVPTNANAHVSDALAEFFTDIRDAKNAARRASGETAEEFFPRGGLTYTVTGVTAAPHGAAKTVGELISRGAKPRDEGVRLIFDDGCADVSCIDADTVEITARAATGERAGELYEYAKNGVKNLF